MKTFDEYFGFDEIVSALARWRVRDALHRRKASFCARSLGLGDDISVSADGTVSRFLPPRNSWLRPSVRVRKHLKGAALSELAIRTTVNACRRVFALDKSEWGRNLLALVADVQTRIRTSEFSLGEPTIRLRRKEDGAYRCLAVYEDVVDRLLTRGVAEYLRDLSEPMLHTECCAFRKTRGISYSSAIGDLVAYRNLHRGERLHVAQVDIVKFFDTVDQSVVAESFETLFEKVFERFGFRADPRAKAFLGEYMGSYSFPESLRAAARRNPSVANRLDKVALASPADAAALHPNGVENSRRLGLPQGGALSPVIANVVLAAADEAVVDSFPGNDLFYRRFCDDMIVVHPDRTVCQNALERYEAAVGKLHLSVHPRRDSETSYGVAFHSDKSKGPFVWSCGGECSSTVPWVGFLGHQIGFDGEVRIRKETLRRHRSSLLHELKSFEDMVELAVENGADSDCLRRAGRLFAAHLVAKGVGFMRAGAVSLHTPCWASAFPNLTTGGSCAAQMRGLDSLRDRILKMVSTITDSGRFVESAYYGRPFSYLGFLRRVERPIQPLVSRDAVGIAASDGTGRMGDAGFYIRI